MAGRRTFVAGEVLTASNINSFLMSQVVAVFDDAAARDAAIPSPEEGNVVYLKDTDDVQLYLTEWGPLVPASGFTASTAITASDSSWPVPALASTVVKVTVVGGGGGGGGFDTDGSNGSTTTFNAGAAGTVTAAGGLGGRSTSPGGSPESRDGADGRDGLTSGNGGIGGWRTVTTQFNYGGSTGTGGVITVAYLDLDGISTVNVTIGAGGARGGNPPRGGLGGDGEVIVEYVAA